MTHATLAELLAAASEGFQTGYEQAKEAGFDQSGILREGSNARVKGVLDAFIAQYGNFEIDGLPALIMSNELVSRKLYDLVMAFEALYTADQATLRRAMDNALEQFRESA
jgi:hypothetical protein